MDERRPKYRPYLPNRKSKIQTPASLRIDLHWAFLGIRERWDWDRFIRFCAFANWTPAELASVIHLPHAKLALARKLNRFPAANAFLLTLLEAKLRGNFSVSDIIKDPFANFPFPNDPPQGTRTQGMHDGSPEGDFHGDSGQGQSDQKAV